MDPFLIINLVLVGFLGAAALRWGAGPEKICAAALFAMTYGDPLYHLLVAQGPAYGTVDVGHLAQDSIVAAVYVGVALQANRVYPIWLAAFQLVSLLSHFAREVTDFFPKLAYGLMNYGPYYTTILILGLGIAAHARRRRRLGPYRSWRTSSRRSPVAGRRPLPNG
ncbi:hypothetical protein [Sphingopyxis solisilvae]|uniref:hypothetical protein n=1 Tax=Sphingopyxis solisilvae TaxID=1886788 RepID=UPI001892A444|nr:hypothetical protein [Sphingopyxis solisilvae]